MAGDLYEVWRAIFGDADNGAGSGAAIEPLGGVSQAELGDGTAAHAVRRFVDVLRAAAEGGGEDRRASTAGRLDETGASPADEDEAFLVDGARRVHAELSALAAEDEQVGAALREAAAAARRRPGIWDDEARRAFWRLFFPEGAALDADRDAAVDALRARRTVTIDSPNPVPLTDPAREILFTSNVLLTLPDSRDAIDSLGLAADLAALVRDAFDEPQRYYYDHPIHLGTEAAANEAVYGLRGLDEAIAFEKQRGTVDATARVAVVLSVSVTHEGLHHAAPAWLRKEILAAGALEHLDVYLLTEPDCRRIVDEAIVPLLPGEERRRFGDELHRVFGVDGEYGRHYTVLKAIAALWQVAIDPALRATFKIDLDQVFPQPELVSQTGRSALEHFTTPLWGARARDASGRPIVLGMIAGALVNEKDIGAGLFTPDVPRPETIERGEAVVFFNKLPMALSTEAEMMTRYDGEAVPDGTTTALQRFHVTGGTNGILIAELRRHRPFTPTFVGRAEDQAYLLSVLDSNTPALRYLHQPGLIMRHDKEAFAGASIAAAAVGRFVGDLARTFVFSRYSAALPWGAAATKREIDPFTGCFVTRRTFSVIFLRLVLFVARLAADGREAEAADALRIAREKLAPLCAAEEGKSGESIAARTARERAAWHAFYDAIDAAAAGQSADSPAVRGDTLAAARAILIGCRLGSQSASGSSRT